MNNAPDRTPTQRTIEQTTLTTAPEERIRLRAYELYEQRGKGHGHDVEDWVRAESELTIKTSSGRAAA
jgi:hypothetical protein